jgi:hypothetical protein
MWRRKALVRTDVSEEHIASIIKVTRISELGTTFAVTNNRSMLQMLVVSANAVPNSSILVTLTMEKFLRSSQTPILTRAPLRQIPEDGILYIFPVLPREALSSILILPWLEIFPMLASTVVAF